MQVHTYIVYEFPVFFSTVSNFWLWLRIQCSLCFCTISKLQQQYDG